MRVGEHGRQAAEEALLDRDTREGELMDPERERLLHHLVEIHRGALGRALAREQQQISDDLRHPVGLAHHQLDRPQHARRHVPREQELAVADDDAERVVQLVGHARHELAERRHLGGLDQLGLRLTQSHEAVAGARVEARVFEGERRLVGERLERLHVFGREGAAGLGAEADGADHPIVREQRHADDGAVATGADPLAHPRGQPDGRIAQDVGRDDDAVIRDRAAHRPLARLEDQLLHDVGVGAVGGQRAQRAVLGLDEVDAGRARVDELGGAARQELGDRLDLQRGRQLAGQAGQHLGHVASPLGLAIGPRVLDGDGGLREEHIDQILRVGAEAQRLRIGQCHHRKELVTDQHGISRERAQAPALDPGTIHEPRVGEHVVHDERPTVAGHPADRALLVAQDARRVLLHQLGPRAAGERELAALLVGQPERRQPRAGQLGGRLRDRP